MIIAHRDVLPTTSLRSSHFIFLVNSTPAPRTEARASSLSSPPISTLIGLLDTTMTAVPWYEGDRA
jgi:hypothetical protein